jgi:hypothetical protein
MQCVVPGSGCSLFRRDRADPDFAGSGVKFNLVVDHITLQAVFNSSFGKLYKLLLLSSCLVIRQGFFCIIIFCTSLSFLLSVRLILSQSWHMIHCKGLRGLSHFSSPGSMSCHRFQVEWNRGFLFWDRILKQYLGLRNREGIGLLYRPVRLNSFAESIPWNPVFRIRSRIRIRPDLN